MGNVESETGKEDHGDLNELLSKFNILQKIHQPEIGELLLLQDKKSQRQYLLREIITQDEEEASQINKRFSVMLKLKHPSVVEFILNQQQEQSQLCSNFYKQQIIYEYIDKSVDTEIKTRADLKNSFTENEVFNMLYSAISGLSYFQKQKISHQNIQPSQLFISPQGTIKIYDSSLFFASNLYSQVATLSSKEDVENGIYLSPILVQALKDHIWQPHHNLYKSDVFSLAMTFINICLLQPCNDCYNYESGIFFEDNLENLLQNVQTHYSKELYMILKYMLQMNEEQRPDFIELEQQIIQMQMDNTNEGNDQNVDPNNQNNNIFQEPVENNQLEVKEEKVKRSKANQENDQDLQQEQVIQQQQQQVVANNNIVQSNKQIVQDVDPKQMEEIQQQQYLQQQLYQQQCDNNQQEEQPFNQYQQEEQQQYQLEPQPNQFQDQNEQNIDFLNNNEPNQQEQFQPSKHQFQDDSFPQFYQPQEQNQDQFILNNQPQQLIYQQQQQQNQQLEEQPVNNIQQQQQQNYQPPSNYQQLPLQASENQVFQQNRNEFQQQQLYDPQGNYQPNNLYLQQSQQQDYKPRNFLQQQQQNYQLSPNQLQSEYVFQQQEAKKPFDVYQPPQDYKPFQQQQKQSQQFVPYEPPKDTYTIQLSDEVKRIMKEYENKIPSSKPTQLAMTTDNSANNNYTLNIDAQFKQPASIQTYQFSDVNKKYLINDANSLTQNPQVSPYSLQGLPSNDNFQQSKEQNDKIDQLLQEGKRIIAKRSNIESPNTQQYNISSNINQYGVMKQSINNSTVGQNTGNIGLGSSSFPVQESSQLSNNNINNNDGFVIETLQNGSKYEGRKANGLRQGQGVFIYPDGGKYVGQWNEGKMHGKGILYYSNGLPAYDGDWENNQFSGFGLLYNEKQFFDNNALCYFQDFNQLNDQWIKYEGSFYQDFKQGQGTLYLCNGEKFVGNFNEDLIDGEGIFYRQNGQTIKGVWKENKLIQTIY